MVERTGSALYVRLHLPMVEDWEPLLDDVHDNVAHSRPRAIRLPGRLDGATQIDADMLKLLWLAVAALGIPVLPFP